MANEFISVLQVEPIPNTNRWIVLAELKYIDPYGNLIIVPIGFQTDFASIPPLARFGAIIALILQFISRWCWELWFVEIFALWVCMIAEDLENSGTDEIATIHDFMYATRCRSRVKADEILFKGMLAKGAWQNPFWKRCLFWINVRLFGFIPWMQDAGK